MLLLKVRSTANMLFLLFLSLAFLSLVNATTAAKLERPIVTIRASNGKEDDISADFEKGLKQANNGGTLVLESKKMYVIGKKLDLSGLKDVWVQIDGDIKFTNDISYWRKNNFYHPFQRSISFWKWGGQDIRIFGKGSIDGNGQKWWDENGAAGKDILDPTNNALRPILFLLQGARNVEISGIKFLNSPAWFTFIVDAKNVTFDHCTFHAQSTSHARPKNTDGFDTYNVDGLVIKNSNLKVDDDCYAAKPNTTNVIIENLFCDGSHGVSMGSIGQYHGVMDYITNVYVRNVTMRNGQNGARLKAWAGKDKGYGYIRNVTFEDMTITNTDHPIVLDSCYINLKPKECAEHPSRVNISDIKFINIKGTSSGKSGEVVASLKCSPAAECKNILLKNIDIKREGSPMRGEVVCEGIKGGVGMKCKGG